MTIVRTEPDGTITAKWSGREIRDAQRGFLLRGIYLSPTSRKRQWGDKLVTIRVVDTDRKYA
jgi:hypothetical protein